ncbi:MAG: hypothetical protein IKR85_09315 [Clostridia bacterium]|nr:hypothetical protein [Clostridia bacterium]
MESFTVTIEELVSQDYTILAESREEAIRKAIEMYKQGEIVLEPGNLEMKRIQVSVDADKWVEF